MEVREARPDELDAAGRVTEAAYAAIEGGWLSDDYRSVLADAGARAEAAVLLVALDPGGAVLGSATYVPGPGPYAEWDDPEAAGIRMLAVAPDAQGRGAGTALVEACLERARAEGKARVILHTTPWMTTAQRIYEGLGFPREPRIDWAPAAEVQLMGYVAELDGGAQPRESGRSPA